MKIINQLLGVARGSQPRVHIQLREGQDLAHKSVLSQIFLDLEPISMFNKPGFLLGARMIDAKFKVPSAGFYTNLVDKVYDNALAKVKATQV